MKDGSRKARQRVEKRALTINEFTEAYSLGRSKTYELIKQGRLKSVVVGGRRLIRVDDAEALFGAA